MSETCVRIPRNRTASSSQGLGIELKMVWRSGFITIKTWKVPQWSPASPSEVFLFECQFCTSPLISILPFSRVHNKYITRYCMLLPCNLFCEIHFEKNVCNFMTIHIILYNILGLSTLNFVVCYPPL